MAWCPRLVGLHRTFHERFFVRKVLRQHVMQVVADRNEVKALVQELSDTICAELEHPEQNVFCLCTPDQFVSCFL